MLESPVGERMPLNENIARDTANGRMLESPVGERMPVNENIAMDTANGFGLRIVLQDQNSRNGSF